MTATSRTTTAVISAQDIPSSAAPTAGQQSVIATPIGVFLAPITWKETRR
jgi:hypothetical protein